MKTSVKLVGSTLVLFAAALGLQAQAINQPNSTAAAPTADNAGKDPYQSTQNSATTPAATTNSSSSASAAQGHVGTNQPAPADNGLMTNGSQQNDPTRGADAANATQAPSITTTSPAPVDHTATATTGAIASQQSSTLNQPSLTASAQSDTEVSSFVQQLDTQGPAIVERVTTHFADITCTPENAKLLFNALHDGTEVTLTADGKTVTFTPTGGKLGYGDAYLALALAAEALHNAGVSGCATPEQWKSVLMGGPLAAAGTASTSTSTTATASSSSNFPGILALHAQGQGWGQVAQTTHVQLDQVVSIAHSSLNLNSDPQLTPTGKTSAEMQQDLMNAGKDQDANKDGHAKDRDQDDNKDDQAQGHDRDNDKGFDQNQGANDANAGATTPPIR